MRQLLQCCWCFAAWLLVLCWYCCCPNVHNQAHYLSPLVATTALLKKDLALKLQLQRHKFVQPKHLDIPTDPQPVNDVVLSVAAAELRRMNQVRALRRYRCADSLELSPLHAPPGESAARIGAAPAAPSRTPAEKCEKCEHAQEPEPKEAKV